ncbi:MAG: ABC transporter ATP-binding protein, partial [Pseudomonas sp.]
VPTGSIYGFLGPNGSGKTTTIRLLLGQLTTGHGAIRVLNEPMPRRAAHVLAGVGYVPERPHLYAMLTVEEAVRYHASFYKSWDSALASSLAHSFRLQQGARLSRLSKGEMGKLMMLLALAQKPELLILDEPTDGLDPAARREVLSALVDFVAQRTTTVFISSHLVHELERICDLVAILDNGHLISEVPIETLKSGMKRLRVSGAPRTIPVTPFKVLERAAESRDGEVWLVQGWQTDQLEWFTRSGIDLREVIDLDLEEGFVALMHSRSKQREPAGSITQLSA